MGRFFEWAAFRSRLWVRRWDTLPRSPKVSATLWQAGAVTHTLVHKKKAGGLCVLWNIFWRVSEVKTPLPCLTCLDEWGSWELHTAVGAGCGSCALRATSNCQCRCSYRMSCCWL